MTAFNRLSLARHLEPYGLCSTLVLTRPRGRFLVSRIVSLGTPVELSPIGTFRNAPLTRIGRIGLPHADMQVPWSQSLSFYGRWFDLLAGMEMGAALRQRLATLAHAQMLAQIARDDQYAVIGSYYAVFRAIMDIKQRTPLVLIDDTRLSAESFSVVLADLPDPALAARLMTTLRLMLRPYPAAEECLPANHPQTLGAAAGAR